MKIRISLIVASLMTITPLISTANMVCGDAYSEIEKSANKIYDPLIASNKSKIEKIKSKGLNPCDYYDAQIDKDIDYCEIDKTYNSIKLTAIDEAKKNIRCLDNNTEVTAQKILSGMNDLAVGFTSVYLGVSIPKQAFYVDIADMKKFGVTGGENSLYNTFKDQAQEYKESLPKIDIGSGGSIIDITNHGGTNKHGLPDVKIGKGFKW